MSIKVDPSNTTATVEATKSTAYAHSTMDVQEATDLIVQGIKREYAIVGDALFATVNAEDAPQWLTAILDNVISSTLNNKLAELTQANSNISTALDAIQIANNNYAEVINIDATVDAAITSRVAQLNASIDGVQANVTELSLSKVTATQAAAIAIDTINAELEDTAFGDIKSAISSLSTAVSTIDETVATNYDVLSANIEALGDATAELENTVRATVGGFETKFAYNSTIKLDDKFYRSGFGIKATTTGGTGTESNPFNSEFWINAGVFKITDPTGAATLSPFTVDTTTNPPTIRVNGIIQAINNGTTTINGSKINAGVIYNAGGTADDYIMKIDLDNGGIYIK